MATIGHWNKDRIMFEEFLFWDNGEFIRRSAWGSDESDDGPRRDAIPPLGTNLPEFASVSDDGAAPFDERSASLVRNTNRTSLIRSRRCARPECYGVFFTGGSAIGRSRYELALHVTRSGSPASCARLWSLTSRALP